MRLTNREVGSVFVFTVMYACFLILFAALGCPILLAAVLAGLLVIGIAWIV